MTLEEVTEELLNKIRRNVNSIDLYSLPRAVLCELIRKQETENATLRQEHDDLTKKLALYQEDLSYTDDEFLKVAAERDDLQRLLTEAAMWQPVTESLEYDLVSKIMYTGQIPNGYALRSHVGGVT
jgi:hypothetical protein